MRSGNGIVVYIVPFLVTQVGRLVSEDTINQVPKYKAKPKSTFITTP